MGRVKEGRGKVGKGERREWEGSGKGDRRE